MSSRDILYLLPHVQPFARQFLQACMAKGHDVVVTCTYRSQEEQDDIYARGRTKPGKIVTWTRHSKHTDRIALDFALVKNGKCSWDIKADFDEDNVADYFEVGAISKEIGFTWGGDWNPPDYCHIEWRHADDT
jgi:peptidoglycan L-alanyl-D-glutamate endopeptidase CwlK